MRYKLNTELCFRKEKFGGLGLLGRTIDIFCFNHMGYDILTLYRDNFTTNEEVVRRICTKYDVAEEIARNDVEELTKRAITARVLVEEEATHANDK